MKQNSSSNSATLCALVTGFAVTIQAQIDPAPRKLLHLGVNQSCTTTVRWGPMRFITGNMPQVPTTNRRCAWPLRQATWTVSWGSTDLLGEHTDLAVGLFRGDVSPTATRKCRGGTTIAMSPSTANGGGANVSIYHLFNPGQPYSVERRVARQRELSRVRRNGRHGGRLELPDDQPFLHFAHRSAVGWQGADVGPGAGDGNLCLVISCNTGRPTANTVMVMTASWNPCPNQFFWSGGRSISPRWNGSITLWRG